MKKRVLAHGLAVAVVLFIGLSVIAVPCQAKEADEILALMEKHDTAYNAQDLDGVMAVYAPTQKKQMSRMTSPVKTQLT